MDRRLAAAPVVLDLSRRVAAMVEGLYVAGSLASGDYRPGISDIDAVALVERVPGPSTRRALARIHEQLVTEARHGHALHCVYVSRPEAGDVRYRHWTWAFDELFRRPLSGIARAELLADPVVVGGPPPPSWLPAMDVDSLREAVRGELTGYWTRAVRKRSIWAQDVYVDVGMTTVVRAQITLTEGRLATKAEAIARMPELGVPPDLAADIGRRREGVPSELTGEQRTRRGEVVRLFIRDRVAGLLGDAH